MATPASSIPSESAMGREGTEFAKMFRPAPTLAAAAAETARLTRISHHASKLQAAAGVAGRSSLVELAS